MPTVQIPWLPSVPGPQAPPSAKQAKEARKRGPLFQLKNTADERELVQYGRQLFAIAFQHRQGKTQEWSEWYAWARGQQWRESRRPSWRSRAQSNYIFSNLFSKAALSTDSRPRLVALPREQRDIKLVRTRINPFLRYVWERSEMDEGYMETMAAALLFGTAFVKPYFDPSLMEGLGDICNEWVDPSFIWPDPGACHEQDGEFMFQVQPLSLDRIARLWPDRAHLVQPEDVPYDFFTAADRLRAGSWQTPVNRKPDLRNLPIIGPMFGKKDAADRLVDIDRALVFELWLKDDKVNRVERIDPRDPEGERLERYEAVYPKGRHIVWAGNVLLTPMDEQESPYENGLWPYVRFRDYLWPNEYWGGGEVEQTKDIQQEMNMMRSRIADHFQTFANGKWIADIGSVADEEVFSNNPQQIIWKRPGSDVRRETGLPLPQGNIDYLAFLQRDMENIGGNTDVNQGRVPERVSSGLAIQEVKEAAQNRVRLTERLARASLKRLAYMWVTLAAQHYSEERIIRVSGEEGDQDRFINVRAKDLKRGFDYEAQVGSEILKGMARLTVNEALSMFEAGIFDEEAVLDTVDVPDKRGILSRIKGRKEEILHLAQTDPDFARALAAAVQATQQGPEQLIMGQGG